LSQITERLTFVNQESIFFYQACPSGSGSKDNGIRFNLQIRPLFELKMAANGLREDDAPRTVDAKPCL
jgi:hypothetical protein